MSRPTGVISSIMSVQHKRKLPNARPLASFKTILIFSLTMGIGFSAWTTMRLLRETDKALINRDTMIEDAKRRRHRESCRKLKTWHDIQDCMPPQLIRPLRADCSGISTWDDVQRCLTGRFFAEDDTGNEEPFEIHIVGERHSGTKWITKELQKCFSNAPESAPFVGKIHRDFIRSKHFFQPLHSGGNFLRSIVVVIVRDPVDWVSAMNEMPYHSPGHVASINSNNEVTPLPWADFVSRPWTMPRPKSDKELLKRMATEPILRSERLCQSTFRFDEVVPCTLNSTIQEFPTGMLRSMYPVYELKRDGSGDAYRNILELRADKIANHVLHLPLLFSLGGYVLVRYEDLLEKGTQFLMEQVSQVIGLQGTLPQQCKPAEPQPDRLRQRIVPKGLKEWIDSNMDVHTERLLGYR